MKGLWPAMSTDALSIDVETAQFRLREKLIWLSFQLVGLFKISNNDYLSVWSARQVSVTDQ